MTSVITSMDKFERFLLLMAGVILTLTALDTVLWTTEIETPTLSGLGLMTAGWVLISIMCIVPFACFIREEGLSLAGLKSAAVKTFRFTGPWTVLTIWASVGFASAMFTYSIRLIW